MKNKLFLFLMMFAMAFTVACGDDPNVDPNTGDVTPPGPEIEVSMEVAVKGEPGASQAALTLTTQGIKQYAFKAFEQGEEPASVSVLLLFSQGQKGDCVDGENTITVNRLTPNTTYTVYVAGIDTTDEYYKEVLSIEVKTREITGEVEQFDVAMDSFKIHVNVNDRVKNGETAYRWALHDIAQSHYLQYRKDHVDVLSLVSNDQVWKNFITDDHTFVFDNTWENRYLCDEKGEPIQDEGGAYPLYYSITPGHPCYFILGEYAWGDLLDLNWISYGYPEGDQRNMGWYAPLYDMEAMRAYADSGHACVPVQDQWWEGYHHRKIYEAAPANVQEGAHRLDATTLAPKGGTLTIIPDERCTGVQFFIATKSMVDEIKMMCFQNDDAMWEKYLPWFTCSESSFDLLQGFVFYTLTNINGEAQNVEFNMEANFFCNPGDEFVVFINGHGPETKEINGQEQPTFENQYFSQIEFVIPESTKPLSTIEVTPVETEDPYSVTFNIKCPSQDAAFVEYLCDYEDAWLEAGMNVTENLINMFTAYGQYNRLTGDILAKINSEMGYDMVIPSRPNAVSYLGAVAYNADKIMGAPASASVRSAKVPLPDPVDQARFDEIAGEWTATATILYAAAGASEYTQMTKTSPVTIGDVKVSETTPQEVYDAYGRKPKEEVDALYAEFYNLVQAYNKEHHDYNRVLCQGFDFQVPADGFESYLRYADPYYLYVADSNIYNGTSTESILWDFGPKWYIELQADGTAYAPFDVTNFAPMTAWIPENYDYYMIAANIIDGMWTAQMPEGCKGFPVVISEDKNTITVKGFEVSYVDKSTGDTMYSTLYPQPAFVQTNQYNSFAWIVSDVVLTRNTSVAAAQARLNAPVKGVKAQKLTINPEGGKFVQPAKMEQKFHQRTSFCSMEKRGTIKIENAKALTNVEDFYKSADACIERNFGVKIVR